MGGQKRSHCGINQFCTLSIARIFIEKISKVFCFTEKKTDGVRIFVESFGIASIWKTEESTIF